MSSYADLLSKLKERGTALVIKKRAADLVAAESDWADPLEEAEEAFLAALDFLRKARELGILSTTRTLDTSSVRALAEGVASAYQAPTAEDALPERELRALERALTTVATRVEAHASEAWEDWKGQLPSWATCPPSAAAVSEFDRLTMALAPAVKAELRGYRSTLQTLIDARTPFPPPDRFAEGVEALARGIEIYVPPTGVPEHARDFLSRVPHGFPLDEVSPELLEYLRSSGRVSEFSVRRN